MRPNVREFITVLQKILPLKEPIYEFGSYQVQGQEKEADLRPLFPGLQYTGLDIRPGPGVDKIQDIHNITLPPASANTILIMDTLEHVAQPLLATSQLHNLLTPDGWMILSTVMNFQIHNEPKDYWRFTPDGIQLLLSQFSYSIITSLGNPSNPHTLLAAATKTEPPYPIQTQLRDSIKSWAAGKK